MKLEDVERFVGIPYDEATRDCADFVAEVRGALFSHDVAMPCRRPRGRAGQAAIGDLSRGYAVPTDAPVDGDLVLMFEAGQRRPGHAGLYFVLDHEAWVLHSNSKNGCSVLHRMRDLPLWGARIEGIYRWV